MLPSSEKLQKFRQYFTYNFMTRVYNSTFLRLATVYLFLILIISSSHKIKRVSYTYSLCSRENAEGFCPCSRKATQYHYQQHAYSSTTLNLLLALLQLSLQCSDHFPQQDRVWLPRVRQCQRVVDPEVTINVTA